MRFRPLRILSYPGREKHQSGTNLENRTPTTFLKLPRTITSESTSVNAIDTVMQCVTTRFEQKDFKFYVKIHAEDLIEVL